jgi:glutamate--cysteine ligase/glutathione synthase
MMIAKGYEDMELSTQILITEAIKRGIDVELLDRKDNFIALRKGDKLEYIKQATRTSADTYVSSLIMENKEVSKLVLRYHGIRTPEGITVHTTEEAAREFPRFRGKDIVVKPKSTNFGKGVVILKQIQSKDEYLSAVQYAFQYDESILMESFIPGREYRFLVIGDETAAVLYRVPANVVGDGSRTIEQLVQEKNLDPLRGEGYVKPLEKLKLGEVERDYLKANGRTFDDIPGEGEIVYLRENSNISTGGDSLDCTDEVREEYKQLAVRAAKAAGANICGVDMIIEDIHATPGHDGYSVIELNFNPALHIHNFPYRGTNRRVETKVLDLLGL